MAVRAVTSPADSSVTVAVALAGFNLVHVAQQIRVAGDWQAGLTGTDPAPCPALACRQ